ncbi:hypothetical protein [Mucilaginibacter psychrotolerans]|uniref:Uncharacterized protein n=1 Tax=Mucilaginibacter psychrotolerans TaxID=1524096 RepID=A0A4Y8S7G9_9SPHI|nr:hypothetical protein [Mucilaginibacter psychrotolerans]TFF34561.1 hypothetical protein E2R66_21675 [Mucilaginibacter psychrotolerans]
MNEKYLNRVLIYLHREMPKYKNDLLLKTAQFVFILPAGMVFQPYYEDVHTAVSTCTGRIRKREMDLDFKVWSPNQERDFKILK